MTLPDAIQNHLHHLKESGYAENTVDQASRNLRYFLNWCMDRNLQEIEEITPTTLQRYQKHLYHYRQKNGQPINFTTQGKRLSTLKRLFKWLFLQGHLSENPALNIELPRRPKKLPPLLTTREAEKILSQPDTSTPLGIRDKALLELLYSSAPTRTETEKLLLSHLDLEEGFLSIKARHNQKGRLIPLTDRAVKWLKIYLSESRPQLSNEGSPQALFLTKEGNALRGAHLGYIVSQNINLADTDKKGSFGLFRHTLAALMLEKGADIRFIQELLGHRSLESTRLYTKVSIRKLKEVHTKTHPGNKPT